MRCASVQIHYARLNYPPMSMGGLCPAHDLLTLQHTATDKYNIERPETYSIDATECFGLVPETWSSRRYRCVYRWCVLFLYRKPRGHRSAQLSIQRGADGSAIIPAGGMRTFERSVWAYTFSGSSGGSEMSDSCEPISSAGIAAVFADTRRAVGQEPDCQGSNVKSRSFLKFIEENGVQQC